MRKFIDIILYEGKKIEVSLSYIPNGEFDSGQMTVSVFRNPTRSQAMGLLKKSYNGCRGIIINNDVYIWDAGDAIHSDIANYFIGEKKNLYWDGFAVVPEHDDLVSGEYDSDYKPISKFDEYVVYASPEAIEHIVKLYPIY